MSLEIFGYISALCFSLCYLPQLWKTWKTKQVEDISVWMWVLQGGAYITGFVYGVNLDSWPLILNYSLGMMYTWIWLVMWYYYRDPDKAYVQKVIREVMKDAKKKRKEEG